MKVLFLNLPYPERLTRRYMCTYVSAMSLFPPYELLSVAGVAKHHAGTQVHFLDCIADEVSPDALYKYHNEILPDITLSLIGLETFEQDINHVETLKRKNPASIQVVFGHYPTLFAEEILAKSKVDVIIKGEPDEVFGELLEALAHNKDWSGIPNISYREGEKIIHTKPTGRIIRINNLPMPAYDLMDPSKYFEPFMPAPFAMIQTSRGCPFSCNYCVTSYGSRFVAKSPEIVINELQELKRLHHIKSFRIIDDTFTINAKRVITICKDMIEKGLNLKWSCLSRTDTLTEEMLQWMKKAGCVRIYFGLESGSQRILDFYKKNIQLDTASQTLKLCKKNGIETAGLFMTGLPFETLDDLNASIRFAIDNELTFAGVGELTLYPGTELYEHYKDEVEFSLFPYKNIFKNKELQKRSSEWRDKFHRDFYLRPGNAVNMSKTFLKNIPASIKLVKHMASARKYETKFYPYIDVV